MKKKTKGIFPLPYKFPLEIHKGYVGECYFNAHDGHWNLYKWDEVATKDLYYWEMDGPHPPFWILLNKNVKTLEEVKEIIKMHYDE